MKIKMDSLVITEYCYSDERIERFCKEVEGDLLFNQFLSHNMREWIEESENTDKLLVGPGYIVADDRKLIGYLRLAGLDFDGVLNLHYGVHPNFRRNPKHYGTKILTEASNYIFKNMSSVKTIELFIKEINSGSIRCAENANYRLTREIVTRSGYGKILVYAKIC